MVLLHGFKKTQQTPDQDLDLAVKRKKKIENDEKNERISIWAPRSMPISEGRHQQVRNGQAYEHEPQPTRTPARPGQPQRPS